MRQNDRRRRLFKTFTACLLAVAMLLSNVGAMEVWAEGTVPAPTITKAFIGTNTISGGNLHRGKINGKNARGTVHVTLKDSSGTAKATVSVTPKSGTTWTVKLPKGVTIAEGDTVTAYQEFNGQKSTETTANAMDSLAKQNKDKLQMPTGEIYIEQTSSNQVNDDEQAEAVEMFNKANTAIAGDIKSVKFSIDTAEHAYYEITYTDGSKSGKVEATNLTIKQVTEYSRNANLNKITIVDNVIKGKLEGKGPFKGIKVQLILKVSDAVKDSYCDEGKCTVDKDTSNPVDATVDGTTGEFSYTITNPDLKLNQVVGVTVKEKNKFLNCSKTTVKPVTVGKTEVKDPRKLTAEDKKAIDAAIRKAYTVNGVSKLPNGTGDWKGVPAVIQIDDSGNVKIFSGNDVKGTWDSNYKFVPEKNADGSYKLNEGAEPKITIPAKDLVKNIKPDAPTVAYDKAKGEITVTPDKADTDAKSIKVTYKDPEGTEKTETATKDEDGKWSVPDGSTIKVDEKTGVITIKDSDIQNKTDVSATVTDVGGIADDDQKAKTSEPGSKPIKIYPKKPEITVNANDGSVTITPVDKDNDKVAKKMDITYTPAGSDTPKTVTAERANDGKWSIPGESDFKVSKDGKSITITNDKIKSNTDITAKTNDGDETDKLESEPDTKNVPDKTAPQPPTVTVDTKDGTAHITPPTDPDTTTIEVKYPGADGKGKTFTATKTDTGWEISGDSGVTFEMSGYISIPYDKLKKADTISATAKDKEGNESKPGTDTSLPPAPTAKENNGVITVTPPTEAAVNGMEITYTPATEGASETKLVAKKQDGKWSIENIPEGVTINESTGVVTIADGTAKEKTNVIAYSSIDKTKKSLEKGEATVPESIAPEAPTVKVQDNGSVTITPKEGSDTTGLNVTYNDQDGNPKSAKATKGKEGWKITESPEGSNITVDENGVITIPTGKTNPGDRVRATASKGKKTSAESNDLTKPAPPTVTPDQKSGNVTITPPTKGNVDGMIIKYKKPDDSEGTIKVKKGEGGTWTFDGNVPEGVEVAGETGVVTIKKGHAKEKTPVTADSTIETLQTPDKNQGEQRELVPDKTAPNRPTVKLEDNGAVTITPPKNEDTTSVTVNYKDANGNKKSPTAKKDDQGKWTIENNDNGETIDEATGVITIPKGNYKTEEAVNATAKDSAGNESGPSEDTPVEISFDANTGTGNMSSLFMRKGVNFKLPANEFTAPEGKEFDGWDVNGRKFAADTEVSVDGNMKVRALWKVKGTPSKPDPQDPANPAKPGEQPKNHYYKASTLIIPNRTPEPVEPAKEMEIGRHIRYLYGYEDRTVRPQGKITRAEAAALIARLAELDMSDKSKPDFADTPSAWYNSAINIMVKKDLMFGDKNGNFRPNEPITRGEFARALLYIDRANDKVAPFADVKGHQFEAAINQAFGNGRINGYPDGTFRPDDYIQRAEAARMLNQYANRGTTLEGMAPVAKDLARFTDIDESHWAYCEIMEAANSHEYQRVKGTQAETWLKILYDEMKK